MRAVDSVLEEIGAGDTPARRSSSTSSTCSTTTSGATCSSARRGAIGISAATGEGVEALLDAIEAAFAETLEPVELLIPYDEGAALSELHAIAGQVEREDREDGRPRPGPGPAQPSRTGSRASRSGRRHCAPDAWS